MDKFGIFKLINTFLDFYSKNKTGNFPTDEDKKEQPSSSNSSIANMLSSLLGQGGKGNQPNVTHQGAPQTAPIRATKPPLQNKMLAVMSSHDSFVKRVKKN